MFPVLSERLFYYVVAFSIILKPHSNFRASHTARFWGTQICLDTETAVSPALLCRWHCSITTFAVSAVLVLARIISGILPSWQHDSLVFKTSLCVDRPSFAVDKLRNSHPTRFACKLEAHWPCGKHSTRVPNRLLSVKSMLDANFSTKIVILWFSDFCLYDMRIFLRLLVSSLSLLLPVLYTVCRACRGRITCPQPYQYLMLQRNQWA